MAMRIFISYIASALMLASCGEVEAPPSPLEALRSDEIVRQFVMAEPFGQVHLRRLGPLTDVPPEEGKTPIVLLHPSPYSSVYFTTFMPHLAKDRLVIAIDTPGFGDSDAPPEPQGLDQYAASVASALEALGFGAEGAGQVDVIGYHTGSLLGVELAVARPDLVRRLMLPGIPYFTGEAQQKAYDRNVVPQPPKADGTHLDKHWDFVSQTMEDGVPLARVQEQYGDLMQAYPRNWWAYHGVFSYASEARTSAMQQPALFISTGGSLAEETKAASKVAPNAVYLHLDHLKHGIFELAPEELAGIARDFFGR